MNTNQKPLTILKKRQNRKILKELQKIWDSGATPYLRLGQLILNVILETELYYISNEELIKRLKTMYVLLSKPEKK